MTRKYDVNNINLEITNVEFWGEHNGNKGGMRVYWDSDIGFGELDIVKTKGNHEEAFNLIAYTENMDKSDDKAFTEKILSLLGQHLLIAE